MKVTKRYNQRRRDLSIDMECEGCKTTETYLNAYDDHNFWVNVVPGFKCNECGESTESLALPVGDVSTLYPQGMVI